MAVEFTLVCDDGDPTVPDVWVAGNKTIRTDCSAIFAIESTGTAIELHEPLTESETYQLYTAAALVLATAFIVRLIIHHLLRR